MVFEDDYNPHMTSKTNIGECSRRETVFEANKALSLLVSSAYCSACLFILSILKETWVIELEDADKYFNHMSAKDLLNHIVDNCNSPDYTNHVNILLSMMLWWEVSHGVP